MAGLYDDAPSRRFAWDADGTVVLRSVAGAAQTTVGQSEKNILNDESNTAGFSLSSDTAAVIHYYLFPEKRDYDGFFAVGSGTDWRSEGHEVSPDTTNGIDGTHDQLYSLFPRSSSVPINFRQVITATSETGLNGMRFQWRNYTGGGAKTVSIRAYHLYGTISAGETPDRILILDTENSDAEFIRVLDFAEVPRGQTQTRTFKLKNNSASLSINSVDVTAEDLYLNAGDWYQFSDDGSTWENTHSVGNMANGAEETIHLRQVLPDGETLGLQTGRIKVSHASVT